MAQEFVKPKPQPNVYTVLLIVAILVLGLTIGLVMYNLMEPTPRGYGLEFGMFFDHSKLPEEIRIPAK